MANDRDTAEGASIGNDAREAGEGALEHYLPFLALRAFNLLSEAFRSELATTGIDLTSCQIINLLAHHGPMTQQQLCAFGLFSQPTASRACLRLANRGLLTDRAGTADRRQRIYELTGAGRDTSRRLMEIAWTAQADTLERTSVDLDRFEALLRQLIVDLEHNEPDSDRSHGRPPTSEP